MYDLAWVAFSMFDGLGPVTVLFGISQVKRSSAWMWNYLLLIEMRNPKALVSVTCLALLRESVVW